MGRFHKLILLALLLFLSINLVIPGIMEMFHIEQSASVIEGISIDHRNQHRALNAMMVGLGILALLACIRLDRARTLVVGIGITLALVAMGRVYSLIFDGIPGTMSLLYLLIETALAVVFLTLPPPANH